MQQYEALSKYHKNIKLTLEKSPSMFLDRVIN